VNETAESRALKRWFTIGVIVVTLWLIFSILTPLRMPIAWAGFFAFLLQPLQKKLTARFGNRPNAAAGVITALTPIAIVAPLVLLGVAFAQQVADLVASAEPGASNWTFESWQDPQAHPRIAAISMWLQSRFHISTAEIQQYVVGGLQTGGKAIAAMSGQLFLNTAGTILRAFLMLFILFFTLRDGAAWFSRLTHLLPLKEPRREALFDRLAKVTRAVVYGCGVTAAVQGILVGIGFAIAGLSGPVVFGVLAGVSALLPFGGAAIVWVPGALYLLFTGHTGWAVFMFAWGGMVSISDNFIRPAIISRYTPVPTLLVFLGVIGGVTAFGLIGFIFGPVILVLATELLRFAEGTIKSRD
jgi:predicted PurR-regulated permease PerM